MEERPFWSLICRTETPKSVPSHTTLKWTATAGRALFASSTLEGGTTLLATDAPFARVVHEPYRRETCEECLSHEPTGSSWPFTHREGGGGEGGEGEGRAVRWFCRAECLARWRVELGLEGVAAVERGESCLVAARRNRLGVFEGRRARDGPATLDEVDAEWTRAAAVAESIRDGPLDREDRLRDDDDPDVFRMVIDAVARSYSSTPLENDDDGVERWRSLASLVPSAALYLHAEAGHATLLSHVRQFLALRVGGVLPSLTASTFVSVATRDVTNAFGVWVRDNGNNNDDDSDAAATSRDTSVGRVLYPRASFFNHSCEPNVDKRRVGHEYVFTIGGGHRCPPVLEGEELCISYLGGREGERRDVRRRLLRDGWGFDCVCPKCERESPLLML